MTDTTDTTPTSVSDADETMRQAIVCFRNRMEAANRKFIQDRVDEIETLGLATEEEKLYKIRAYWGLCDVGKGGIPGCGGPMSPKRFREGLERRQVTRLADVPAVPHHQIDGIQQRASWNTEARQKLYLETVQQVCQAAAEEFAARYPDDDEPVGVIPPCDELACFLRHVNSVRDMDMRISGMAPFHPVLHLGGRREDDEDDDGDDLGVLGEKPRKALEEVQFTKIMTFGSVGHDIEVKVGFITGEGCDMDGYTEWFSAYLYCRRWVEDDDPRHRDWAWRIFFFDDGIENPRTLYGHYPRFDSISEFLDWYSSWPDYLDMDRLRRMFRRLPPGCDSDCESDCEGHEWP
ncbi:hypothetical protein BO78DRAFT_402147 [Aspergillus sclerotiicarbonarius CBS 121057]|uniref:Uncharacterized protein n=1 Tax=Aspergillus sclerotiicarbonarius (strain CBS 121057 / IBT 28362) TaxID=1448318 RepID=A0A319F5A0_ASPSB|nr:hypothetical protein BO78DRAFT_402147 [Aspergillus sclerotiicarbonarius CBS 121057]